MDGAPRANMQLTCTRAPTGTSDFNAFAKHLDLKAEKLDMRYCHEEENSVTMM